MSGRRRGEQKGWRTFEEAREYVRSLGLRSVAEWTKWRKSGERPPDIPTNPNTAYKNEWTNMGDWLGTGAIATAQKHYRPFEEARKHARNLGLKSARAWERYAKSGKCPSDIPSNPQRTYKSEWNGWPDWLNTNNQKVAWRPFEDARAYVRSLGLESNRAWREFSKSPKKPPDIPRNPVGVYKDDGWLNWGDWLGTGYVANRRRTYRPFEEAHEYVHSLGLGSTEEWNEYARSGERPDDIPTFPRGVYADQGWIDMADWLGTGQRRGRWRSFEEARAYVRSLGIRNHREWKEYCRSGRKPDDIPASPNWVYGDRWKRR